jgi:hypothetical protein
MLPIPRETNAVSTAPAFWQLLQTALLHCSLLNTVNMGGLPCCERHRKPPSFACTEIQYSHTRHNPFKLLTDMQGLTLLPHYVDMGDLPELVVSLTKKELLL